MLYVCTLALKRLSNSLREKMTGMKGGTAYNNIYSAWCSAPAEKFVDKNTPTTTLQGILSCVFLTPTTTDAPNIDDAILRIPQ